MRNSALIQMLVGWEAMTCHDEALGLWFQVGCATMPEGSVAHFTSTAPLGPRRIEPFSITCRALQGTAGCRKEVLKSSEKVPSATLSPNPTATTLLAQDATSLIIHASTLLNICYMCSTSFKTFKAELSWHMLAASCWHLPLPAVLSSPWAISPWVTWPQPFSGSAEQRRTSWAIPAIPAMSP